MAVTISRTAWTDDDGTGTTGTVINNAFKTELYNQIDAALALVPALNAANVFTHAAGLSLAAGDLKFISNAGYGLMSADDTRAIGITNAGVTVGDLLTVSGFGAHSFSAGGSGGNSLSVRNTIDGAGNYADIWLGTSEHERVGLLRVFAPSFATSTWSVASGLGLVAQYAGGISIAATHASGPIRFYSGGATERGQFTPTGNLFLAVGLQMSVWPTTGSAANAVLVDTDVLRRSTSSLRYKTDVRRLGAAKAKAVVLGLRPITYRGIHDGPTRFAGFAAEDVAKLDRRLVTFDKKGRPDYVTYDRVPAYLVPVVQDLERRLATLEERTH